MLLLYHLLRLDYSRTVARMALIALVAFPSAFSFMALYTESLFLLLGVAALYCGRRDRWALAGLFCGLAALCRVPGAMLVIPLGVRWLMVHRREWRRRWSDVPWLALGPAALLAVFAVDGLKIGRFAYALTAESVLRRRVIPFSPLWHATTQFAAMLPALHLAGAQTSVHSRLILQIGLELGMGYVILFLVVAAFFVVPLDWSIFGLVLSGFCLLTEPVHDTSLLSFARYMGWWFPLFVVQARLLGGGPRRRVAFGIISVMMLIGHVWFLAAFAVQLRPV